MDLAHIYFSGSLASKTAAGYFLPNTAIRKDGSSRPLHERAEFAEPDPFTRWVLQSAGISAGAYQAKPLHRRLQACLRFLRVDDTDKARALLRMKPELLPEVLNTLLIGVSGFFRDKQVFDLLREAVLPRLVAERGGLRICSVGVSNGQELYSIAMLVAEMGALAKSEFAGIDCRSSAIRCAEAGVYDAEEMQGISAALRERYFTPAGRGYAVRRELRERMCWKVSDLFSFGDERAWDIILFRNVAIYFKPSAAADAWQVLADQLAPGGCLITGTAEKPFCTTSLRRLAPCIYVKTGHGA